MILELLSGSQARYHNDDGHIHGSGTDGNDGGGAGVGNIASLFDVSRLEGNGGQYWPARASSGYSNYGDGYGDGHGNGLGGGEP
jgi:hypothetical protein